MKQVLFNVAVFCALFFNSNLSTLLGFQNNVTTVAFLPITLFLFSQIVKKQIFFFRKRNIHIMYILSISIIILLFKLLDGQNDMFKSILMFSLIPYIFAVYLENASEKEKSTLQKMLLALLITECLLALYERLNLTVLLATEETYSAMNRAGDSWSFRSSALFGHPLGNAMLVSVINIFILSSDLSANKKITYFLINLLALLCFNERGNIAITVVTSIPLLIQLFKKGSKQLKRTILLIGIPLFIGGIIQIAQSDFGGRLFNEQSGKHDNSTMARLEAFRAFDYLNNSELLIGGNHLNDKVAAKMHLAAVENGIISILLDYGIVLGIPLLWYLFLFQKEKLSVFPWWNKWLILLLFYGIGFTNPHLSNPMQWFIFICSYYAFRPKTKNRLYERKHVFRM